MVDESHVAFHDVVSAAILYHYSFVFVLEDAIVVACRGEETEAVTTTG